MIAEKRCVTCALTGETMTKRVNHCDAIVLVEAQMPDLFTSPVSLHTYAASKSKRARDMKEFVNPWEECPSCHQDYQHDLATDIANKFVSFVRRQYPSDTQRQVEALYVKCMHLIPCLGDYSLGK